MVVVIVVVVVVVVVSKSIARTFSKKIEFNYSEYPSVFIVISLQD